MYSYKNSAGSSHHRGVCPVQDLISQVRDWVTRPKDARESRNLIRLRKQAGDRKTMAKKNTTHAIISRNGLSFEEKFVHVTLNYKTFRMDPQYWIQQATGQQLDRE
jgi:hypothetical protein